MKRICHGCAATDKTAVRSKNAITKKQKAGYPLDETDVDLTKLIAKKTPEEKVLFYQQEKKKREETGLADGTTKRTMSDIKGTLETGTTYDDVWDDLDGFETFEDYALRQIGLRRAANEKEAEVLWKDELGKNEKPKVWRRNQWLLGKYNGLMHHQQQTDSFRLTVKRSQEIETQEDFEDFKIVSR